MSELTSTRSLIRPDSALDRSAYARGNSTYFPDRVLPMLPTALSNGWCSLNPREDRPCMAVHLWIDAEGRPRMRKQQYYTTIADREALRTTVRANLDGAEEHAGAVGILQEIGDARVDGQLCVVDDDRTLNDGNPRIRRERERPVSQPL